MTYSLWDLGSGNLIDSFDSETAALQAVLDEVRVNNDAEDLALEAHDPSGQTVPIAAGRDLLNRAHSIVGRGAITA